MAYGNGFNRWNIPNYTGDGTGSSSAAATDTPAAHIIRNSMAWDNSAGGFIDNSNPGTLQVDHYTAWRNGGTGFDFADSDATLTRNLSVSNRTTDSLGSNSSRQQQLVGPRWHLDAGEHRRFGHHRAPHVQWRHRLVDLPATQQRRRCGRPHLAIFWGPWESRDLWGRREANGGRFRRFGLTVRDDRGSLDSGGRGGGVENAGCLRMGVRGGPGHPPDRRVVFPSPSTGGSCSSRGA